MLFKANSFVSMAAHRFTMRIQKWSEWPYICFHCSAGTNVTINDSNHVSWQWLNYFQIAFFFVEISNGSNWFGFWENHDTITINFNLFFVLFGFTFICFLTFFSISQCKKMVKNNVWVCVEWKVKTSALACPICRSCSRLHKRKTCPTLKIVQSNRPSHT